MKVVVDWNLCESNGLCMDACPDVFRLDDDDQLVILIERPDEGLRTQVEQAVRVCPRQALSLED
jgi:ferredoxin